MFGASPALALLVLTGQGLAQLVSRSAPDIAVLRALGVTRGQAGLGRRPARADIRPGRRGAGRGRGGGGIAAGAGRPGPAVRPGPRVPGRRAGPRRGRGRPDWRCSGCWPWLAPRSVRSRERGAGAGSSAVARAAAAPGCPPPRSWGPATRSSRAPGGGPSRSGRRCSARSRPSPRWWPRWCSTPAWAGWPRIRPGTAGTGTSSSRPRPATTASSPGLMEKLLANEPAVAGVGRSRVRPAPGGRPGRTGAGAAARDRRGGTADHQRPGAVRPRSDRAGPGDPASARQEDRGPDPDRRSRRTSARW